MSLPEQDELLIVIADVIGNPHSARWLIRRASRLEKSFVPVRVVMVHLHIVNGITVEARIELQCTPISAVLAADAYVNS